MDIIIVNLYLLLGTVQDIQKRKISNCYLWIGGIIGFVFRIINLKEESYSFSEWLLALIPGVILLLLAKVTGEKIGFGDGWVVIILGNFMTILEISREPLHVAGPPLVQRIYRADDAADLL